MKEIETAEDYISIVEGVKTELVLIDYYASWCRPCKKLAKYLNNIESEYKSVVFYKLDIEELEDDLKEDTLPDNFPTVSIIKKGKLLVEFKFGKKRNWTIIATALDKLCK